MLKLYLESKLIKYIFIIYFIFFFSFFIIAETDQNIKKLNRKDDFVDIYDGSKWKLRMIDYAYSQVMGTLEKLFTDYIDNLIDAGELESMKRTIKVFCNKISTVLDWEFNNLDKNREPEESEVKTLECKLKKLISETLYRESLEG